MGFPAVYFILTICGFFFIQADDCVYKVCLCSDGDIRCPYRDLTSLPPLTGSPHGQWRLILDNNKLTSIPSDSLPPNLTSISMLNNPIATISIDAFNGSTHTLNELYFSFAGLTRIPDAIGRLKALYMLTIYNTNIQEWNEEVIKKIGPTLTTLDLVDVGLTSWPMWVKYLTNLTDLTLSGNSFSSVPGDALDNLANTLTRLSLSMNNLKSLSKTFSNLKNLEFLELENNQIINITWIPRSNRLISLALSNNNIRDAEHLSDSLSTLKNSLKSLTIDNNQLSSIPNLSYLKDVTDFDFSRNRISDPYSGSLPATLYNLDFTYNNLPAIPVVYLNLPVIKYMVLTSNSITEIQASQIPLWIVEANLENNLITELSDTSFQTNSGLTYLILTNNPITKISNNAFMNLQRLTMLDLQGTRLTRIPLALFSLVSLTSLNVANSDNLICTCQEKGVASVVLKPGNTITGDCGLTSVYDFFHRLSPYCR